MHLSAIYASFSLMKKVGQQGYLIDDFCLLKIVG